MPKGIPFPKVDVSINFQGLANHLQAAGLGNIQPTDNYEVINSAKNPKGEHYWNAVNYGIPLRMAKVSISQPMIRGGVIRANKVMQQTSIRKMRFMVAGKLIGAVSAKAVAPVHMRERALVEIKKIWVHEIGKIIKGRRFSLPTVQEWADKRVTVFTSTRESPNSVGEYTDYENLSHGFFFQPPGASVSGQEVRFDIRSRFQPVTTRRGLPRAVYAAMERAMDGVVSYLATITPVLQAKYYNPGWTSPPGELANSYSWRKKGIARDMSTLNTKMVAAEAVRMATQSQYGYKHPVARSAARRAGAIAMKLKKASYLGSMMVGESKFGLKYLRGSIKMDLPTKVDITAAKNTVTPLKTKKLSKAVMAMLTQQHRSHVQHTLDRIRHEAQDPKMQEARIDEMLKAQNARLKKIREKKLKRK